MRSFIFFVEGVHDVNCVARVLILRGFKEANTTQEIPKMWKERIPTTYPFVKYKLDRHIPMPSYFIKNNLCVTIVSSNGSTNIIRDIDLYLSNMKKDELKQINGVCAIFDADQENAKEAFIQKTKKYNKDIIVNQKDFLRGYVRIRGENIGLYTYFFPDNNSKGTLENFLLEGAKIIYDDLLISIEKYVESIDEKHKYNWSISSENKVKVGCIANVFQPGGANQTSIRYDDWISEETIIFSKTIKKFYDFIVDIVD